MASSRSATGGLPQLGIVREQQPPLCCGPPDPHCRVNSNLHRTTTPLLWLAVFEQTGENLLLVAGRLTRHFTGHAIGVYGSPYGLERHVPRARRRHRMIDCRATKASCMFAR